MEVVQVVQLFILEMWVMYPCTGRKLGRFHQWVIRQLMGWKPKRKVDRTRI